MSHAFRLVVSKTVLAAALLLIVATPSRAQYLGKMTGPPTWPSARAAQESVVAEKEMRRVEERLHGIAAAIQELSSMPSAGRHEEMIGGMSDALNQLQLVHAHLRAMLTDPTLLENRKAALSFSRVHRQLETTAVALGAMAKSTTRAVRDESAGTD